MRTQITTKSQVAGRKPPLIPPSVMPKTEVEPSEVITDTDMSSLGYVRNARKATTRDASP